MFFTRLHKFVTKGFAISMAAICINISPAYAFNFDHLPYYETDQITWGQVAGCVLRFDYYRYLSKENMNAESLLPAEAVDLMISAELGNTEDAYVYLYDMGYNNGFLDDNALSGEAWENAILDLAEREYEEGLAWLQTVSCVKILTKHKIIQ